LNVVENTESEEIKIRNYLQEGRMQYGGEGKRLHCAADPEKPKRISGRTTDTKGMYSSRGDIRAFRRCK